ncbi:MAG: signal peptidase I [Bacillota bacterium]
MKRFLKYVDRALNVLILFAMVAVIWTSVKMFLGHETFIKIGNFQVYQVLSGSMVPVFDREDFIIIEKVEPEEITPGDIITYKTSEDSFVTHRVLTISHNREGSLTVVTKGDANSSKDEPIVLNKENLEGKLYMGVPFLGKVSKFTKSTYGFILMACLPISVVLITFIATIFRRSNNTRSTVRAEQSHK